jgi:outer membrane lipoprotein-sorting protein
MRQPDHRITRFYRDSAKAVIARTLAVSILIAVAQSSFLPVAARNHTVENFNSQGPFVKGMQDGKSVIAEMVKAAQNLNDYSLTFETITFKKNDSISERGNLYFKKPKLMRLEETGEYKNGSVAVLGKDGKVRAHAGGLVKFVTVTMDAGDKELNAANGDRMEDSDFLSLANVLRDRLKLGQSARVSQPADAPGLGERTLVLEIFKPSEPDTVLKRIFVNPRTYLPVRWDDYDYKSPCSSTWKNVKANTGLSDDLFKL